MHRSNSSLGQQISVDVFSIYKDLENPVNLFEIYLFSTFENMAIFISI